MDLTGQCAESSLISGPFNANIFQSLPTTHRLTVGHLDVASPFRTCPQPPSPLFRKHKGFTRVPLSSLQLYLPYKLPVAQLRVDRQLVVRDELLYWEDLWGQLPHQCDSGVEMALSACSVYSSVIGKLLWPLFSCMDVLKAGDSCGSQYLHVSLF